MSKKIEQTNPVRVYAKMREKGFALLQIVGYYNETFSYEILPNVTATVFPMELLLKWR